MKRSASSQRIQRVALAIGAALFALLISEFGLRVFRVAPDLKVVELDDSESQSDRCVYRRSKNPVLGFELKPNYRHDSPDFIESYERTNEHGQRDVDRSLSSNKRRILILGDSVVEGSVCRFPTRSPGNWNRSWRLTRRSLTLKS